MIVVIVMMMKMVVMMMIIRDNDGDGNGNERKTILFMSRSMQILSKIYTSMSVFMTRDKYLEELRPIMKQPLRAVCSIRSIRCLIMCR